MTRSELRLKAYEYLKSSRIKHVAGCEYEAVKLAKKYGVNEELAAVSAILHDITKKESYESQLELIEKYNIDCDDAQKAAPALLHAITGAALAKDVFGISDDVYMAIRYHTTGKPDMTPLEKVIYLADFSEPSRDFPGVKKLRELCDESLDKAMAFGLELSIEEIKEKGQIPYKDTLEAYEYYKTANP